MGGTAEIVVENSTGLLHPVGSHGEQLLINHLHYLMCNKNEAYKMGKMGMRRVKETYLDDLMYQELGDLFQKVLKH